MYVKQFDVSKKTWIFTDTSKLYSCAYILTQLSGEVNEKGEEE